MDIKGKLIYFEGIDGCGKGTQLDIARAYLESKGFEVAIYRQPGGTKQGQAIRELILNSEESFQKISKILLFAADRYELSCKMKEDLDEGKIVLCDRSVLSSYVYQDSYAEVSTFNQFSEKLLKDYDKYMMLFTLDGNIAYNRMMARNPNLDNMEKDLNPDIMNEMNNSYIFWTDRVANWKTNLINANRSIEEVSETVLKSINAIIGIE